MAGIPTPQTMDGRSILTQLIPESAEPLLPAPTRLQLQRDRNELVKRPWRKEQFHQYYNQGGPSPMHPQQCPQTTASDRVGVVARSSTNQPKLQATYQRKEPNCFPRDLGRKATVRPLDDYSNTYIGLHLVDPQIGSGHYK